MKIDHNLRTKPIGEILEEAGLINKAQVQVALNDQNIYSDFNLRLGEILVLHGWLPEKTADFFGEQIKSLAVNREKKQIGKYFYEAGLLSEEDIRMILDEQEKLGIKFGAIAVLRGCVKQKTLDFFLKYFFPESYSHNNFSDTDEDILEAKINSWNNITKYNSRVSNHENIKKLNLSDVDFEVP